MDDMDAPRCLLCAQTAHGVITWRDPVEGWQGPLSKEDQFAHDFFGSARRYASRYGPPLCREHYEAAMDDCVRRFGSSSGEALYDPERLGSLTYSG